MRVLVTRPHASSEHTLRRLAGAGHAALCLPMTEAEHFPDGIPHALHVHDQTDASALMPPRALAVTSAEAIKALRHVPDHLAALRSWPVYGVGPVTAEAARDAGFREIHIGPGDGAGLARRVVEDYGVQHGGLLYCAGLPRAPDFERIIVQAGVPLDVVIAYRMQPVRREPGDLSAAIASFAPDVILFHSREAVRLFFSDIAPAQLQEAVRILCLAGRIASAVPPGCRHVEVAARPEETALLALLDA